MGIIGNVVGGPVGAKTGVFIAAGAGESAEVYTNLVNQGYSYEEANRRANMAYVIDGLIEAQGGGILKYKPTFGAGKKLMKVAGKFGMNFLKEMG